MVVNGTFDAHILQLTLDMSPLQCRTDRSLERNSKTDNQEEKPNDKFTV
jgi:hypothetical protein